MIPKSGMKVLICGGRNFANRRAMVKVIASLRDDDLVIHGGASGADRLAGQVALEHGIHTAEVKAIWPIYGKGAGPRRNTAMLALRPDKVIAFPGGNGTGDCIRQAIQAGVPVERAEW